jgi:circadian clock protein KaiC
MERISTGVRGLDAVVGGGLWRGSTTLVVGTAGTGKTTLGLEFALAGVRAGESALFLNLQESPTQLAQTIRALGADYDDFRTRGLALQYESPVELRIDALVVRLSRTVRERGVRRLVIDGLSELLWAAVSEQRFHDYVYALTQQFRAAGVTAILNMEASPQGHLEGSRQLSRVSALCDGLIVLENTAGADREGRWIRVVKMRGNDHELGGRPFTITEGGIQVMATSADA